MTSKPANTFRKKTVKRRIVLLLGCAERRQGLRRQRQPVALLTDLMMVLIRDIQLARHNIEMVFYICAAMAGSGR